MGSTDLHQLLKTLCSNSVWNYAVFWKLKHRARMVLTWEDAYYENCEQRNLSESKCFGETDDNLHSGGRYSHEPLGLAGAKMSYHVHSLGEGIVGQVAVTQQHQWIFADATSSCARPFVVKKFLGGSSDGLENQFSAGIKTILVVAVVPHGVVQLGSSNKPDLPAASLASEGFPDCLRNIGSDHTKSPNLYSNVLQSESFGGNHLFAPLSLHDSAFCGGVKLEHKDCSQKGESHLCEFSDTIERNLENRTKLSHLDLSNTNLKFWAGSELHEGLGPAFSKQSTYSDWESEKVEAGATTSSLLTFDSGSEDLLEAVVANVCNSSSDVKSERSSMQSLLTTDENRQRRSTSSDLCSLMPSKWFSSSCPSICSEPAKNNKKRARPGENSKPRPRDKQLIQDRIKELRELVPNGSKCSIDSLLEHTIKHMLFLQNINKHADKLSKCAEAKMRKKGTGILGSPTYEQGSSWAVEVGGHLKVCLIVVENLNKNGQMLVEMICECSHFLEIAEAIRSIGLTILKGITEAQGDKMWICFVVEGQNNRVTHRMDILWSLVQILQPNSTS